MKNSQKNTPTEAHTATKRVGVMVLLIFFTLFLIGNVSAFEFDNIGSYDRETKTITIYNWNIIGKIFDIKLAEVQLISPLSVELPLGYHNFANITITSYSNYDDILKSIDFYDRKINRDEFDSKNKFERDFDLMVREIEEYNVIDYKTICQDYTKIASETNICYQEEVGTHTGERIVFRKLDPANLKEDDILNIELWTEVKNADNVEWIPSFMGVRINEWARFNATGGTITYDGIFQIHTFTTNGTFTITGSGNISEILIIAGAGAGGGTTSNIGGGGGAGGLVYATNLSVNAGAFPIYVGAGGNGLVSANVGSPGQNSSALGLVAIGGGGGGGSGDQPGNDGGSGGGGSGDSGGSGLQGNFSNATGFGRDGGSSVANGGGAGGGANDVGGDGANQIGGNSSNERAYDINGTSFDYSCGGAGGGTISGYTGTSFCGGGAGGGDENGEPSEGGDATTYGSGGGGTGYNGTAGTYAGGDGMDGIVIIRFISTLTAPTINLDVPVDTANFTTNNIIFNATIFSDTNISNVSFILDNQYNETNLTSGINNVTWTFNKIISDGDYTWTMEACDFDDCGNATARTFSIDTTDPVINITDPINASTNITGYITANNATINLKWTTTDTNIDKCWYYNTTDNITITCDDNATIYLPYDKYTFYIYANDTFGHEITESVTATWNYSILENSITYNAKTYETDNETFEMNLSYYSEDWGSIAVNLIYNGTAYTTTKDISNNYFTFNKEIDIPKLSGTSTENKTFYWDVQLTNNTGTFSYNSTEYTQTVYFIPLQLCAGNINETILNFTAWHEENITNLTDFDFYGTFKFWIGDGTYQKNISISNVTVNYIDLCIDNSSITYYIDAHIQYEKTNFVKRTFYLINDTSITSINNISLFLLPISTSESFIIEILDDVQLPIRDAYIYIQRYYPGIDRFRTVEMGKTDITGSTVGHFEAETEDYRIIVEKDGTIIYQSGSQKIFCEESPCKLSFQIEAGAGISWTEIGVINLFDWNMTYDESGTTWTFNYVDTSGEIGYGRLYVYYDDPIEGEVMICNESSSSLAATLTCNVSGYNGTIYASSYLSRSPEILVNLKSIVISALKAIFGLEGLFLSLFVLMVLAFAGLWNPTVGIILVVVGMIVLNLTGLAVFGATAIWGIIFIALLILWNLKT